MLDPAKADAEEAIDRMSVSVCLARAQRPHLHLDRNSNLNGSKYLVAYSPDRQLLGDASIALQTKGSLDSDSSDAAGITAQLELVKDQYQLYLGGEYQTLCTPSNAS